MKKAFSKYLKTFFKLCIIPLVVILGIGAGALYGFFSSTTLIDVENLKMNFTSFIYYTDPETGETKHLQTLYDTENRVWADLEEIPEDMRNAFVAIEDERFYQHKGFDVKRTLSAALNLFSKDKPTYGGSTITQQLVKNITKEEDVSLKRKLQELYRAYMLEKEVNDKDAILELYLNTIYLSQNCNGVGAAAEVYFDKDVSELSLAECASIAGITQFPSKYDPYLNPEANKEKQEIVLGKMLELGYISQEECEAAKAQKLEFKRGEKSTNAVYSYFVDMVIDDVIDDLQTEKQYSEVMATKMLYSGGLNIYATIDPNVQKAMETVYEDDKNFPKVPGDKRIESAMIVIDPKTGEIKGVVGGRGKKEQSRILNRVNSVRQPGSSIKPIGVYAPAIEEKVITPRSMIKDEPVDYDGWTPKNASGRYYGEVSAQYALAQSLNAAAVSILDDLTVEKSFRFLEDKLHISSLVASSTRGDKVFSDKNLSSLALGGLTDGISVREMANAYVPFANKGIYKEAHTYSKITDYNGNLFMEKNVTTSVAMDEYTSYTMTQMLKNAVATGTGRGAAVRGGMPTAGKTGTTDDDVDKWFIGYTPYYVGAVWNGYDQPKAMKISGNPSVSIWKKVMDEIHKGKQVVQFERPSNMISVSVCQDSGLLATGSCLGDPRGSRAVSEYFKPGTQPTKYCDIQHFIPEEPVEEEVPPEETGETPPPGGAPERSQPPDSPAGNSGTPPPEPETE